MYYLAEVLCKRNKDCDFNFRESSFRKYDKSFIYPEIEDVFLVFLEIIKMMLPKLSHVRTTKRQKTYLQFEVNVSALEVRYIIICLWNMQCLDVLLFCLMRAVDLYFKQIYKDVNIKKFGRMLMI